MFIPNKYTRWYYQIIDRAKLRSIVGYTESHHIVPKCMGGNDTKENRVTLTAREHALCHWLLTKMVEGPDRGKMFYGLKALTMTSKYQTSRIMKVPTKTIAYAREQASVYSSAVQKGRKRSQESIEKQRATMTGRIYSKERRQNMSAGMRAAGPSGTPAERSARSRLNGSRKSITDLTRKGSEQHSSAREYVLISPQGEEFQIRNLLAFCEQHNLSRNCMSSVVRNYPNSQHKGWKARKVQ